MIQLVRPSGVVDVPTAMISHDEGQQSSAFLSAAGQIRNAMLTESQSSGLLHFSVSPDQRAGKGDDPLIY